MMAKFHFVPDNGRPLSHSILLESQTISLVHSLESRERRAEEEADLFYAFKVQTSPLAC